MVNKKERNLTLLKVHKGKNSRNEIKKKLLRAIHQIKVEDEAEARTNLEESQAPENRFTSQLLILAELGGTLKTN